MKLKYFNNSTSKGNNVMKKNEQTKFLHKLRYFVNFQQKKMRNCQILTLKKNLVIKCQE